MTITNLNQTESFQAWNMRTKQMQLSRFDAALKLKYIYNLLINKGLIFTISFISIKFCASA